MILDVPVAVAASRRRAALRSVERYDDDGYQERVASNYRRLARGDGAVVLLDGSRGVDEVASAVALEVDRVIAGLGSRTSA